MTDYPNHTRGSSATLQIKRGSGRDAVFEAVQAPASDGFLAEGEAFADLVKQGPEAWNGVQPKESIDIALTLEAIEESARSGRAVELPRANAGS